MRDMHVGHDPVVVTQDRMSVVLDCTAADRAELPDRVAIADRQSRRLIGVLLILRIVADGRKLVDAIVAPYRCRSVDHDMAIDARAGADFDILADNRIGTDLDVFADLCAIRNYRCWMNHAGLYLLDFSSLPTRSFNCSSRRKRATFLFQSRAGSATKLPAYTPGSVTSFETTACPLTTTSSQRFR